MNILLNLLISVLSLKVAIMGCAACTPEQKDSFLSTASAIEQSIQEQMAKPPVEATTTPIIVYVQPTAPVPPPVVDTPRPPTLDVTITSTSTKELRTFTVRVNTGMDAAFKFYVGNNPASVTGLRESGSCMTTCNFDVMLPASMTFYYLMEATANNITVTKTGALGV